MHRNHPDPLTGRLHQVATIQDQVDQIFARSRARFGHGEHFMEAGGSGDGAGGSGSGSGAGGDGAGAGGSGAGAGAGGDGSPAGGDGTDQLGDAGKQALDRMKSERNAANQRAKTAEDELAKVRNASKTEQEKAIDAARKEGETQALATANARLVRSEVKVAAAAAKFRDAGDAVAQLGSKLAEITVDDDGEVDGAAVKKLIDDLAKAKPYLVNGGSTASDAGIGTVGDRTTPDPGPGRARMASAYGAAKS